MNNLALKFIAPGTPVAKGRARVSSRGGFIRHYTPEKTVSYENTVRGYAVQAMRKANMQIIDVPCGLELMIYMPIPAKWSKSKKEKAKKGELRPGIKPDCSNLAKAIEDAMNGVVYTDDKFICALYIQKFYSDLPRAEISVFILEED